MDEQPAKNNRGAEAFNVGAIAVENSESPDQPETKLNNLGSLAVNNSDRPLIEPDEQVVTVIRRHVIGIIGIYTEMLSGIALVVIAVALAIAGVFGHLDKSGDGLVVAVSLFIVGFLVMLLLVSSYVYRQCRIIVTDKSLITIMQKALFARKVSRLSMANVEDVTAEQHGLLSTIFNYGTLTIQTAGEEDNFIFTLCPRPNDIAEKILESRQAYVRSHGD